MEVRCKKLAPSSSSCFITNLPTPILMEILCGLPIKTLTACKIVCKSWLHLSRDPHFAQLHQARAPTEVCFQLRHDRKLHMGNFHCRDVKLNALFEYPQNTLNYQNVTSYFIFSNSCNGLLCYSACYHNRFAMVCNPCTNEFITLLSPATSSNCCRYGFGFSRKTNKYKLLRLVGLRIGVSHVKNVAAEICTIEKGCSWTTLGPCPSYVLEVIDYCTRSDKYPTFLHGTLHWPSKNKSIIDILTFDFEDEQFGRVPLPPSVGKGRDSWLCQVGELSGFLFITEYTNKGINVWLMKEYGVQDSWTKMYSLPCIVMGERLNKNGFLPVTCMDNNELLLADVGYKSTRVFSYNPDQEGFRLMGSGRFLFLTVIAYKPSLVPLKDSMLGYKVHVSALKHREMSTSPDWWNLHREDGKRKGHVKATSQSSVLPNVSPTRKEETEKKRKVVEPFKEQIQQLEKHIQQLEERLQDEKVQVKQQIQQNQQLEKRLKNEHAKLKQMEEKYSKARNSRRKSNK